MGVTLEFYLGAAEPIRKAVEEDSVDTLFDPGVVKGRADMSLHITPHDLDALSEEFASVSGHDPVPLRPHLEVLFDDPERGALLVDDFWVSYAALVPKSEARRVTERWVNRMSQEYDDPGLTVTDAAVQAVEDLLSLCARAKTEGQPMVHVWYL